METRSLMVSKRSESLGLEVLSDVLPWWNVEQRDFTDLYTCVLKHIAAFGNHMRMLRTMVR